MLTFKNILGIFARILHGFLSTTVSGKPTLDLMNKKTAKAFGIATVLIIFYIIASLLLALLSHVV